jgi:PEP-CTERM motif
VKHFALPTLFAIAAQIASANIIPSLDSITPNGANFNWNYRAEVTLDQDVVTGNFFTIFDFGPILGSTIPSGWLLSLANLGTTPVTVLPVDSPLIQNLTLTRTGGLIGGPASLGIFTFVSSSGGLGSSDFAALGTRNSGPQVGSTIANVGSITTPIPSGADETVPEPATFALIGIGLLAIPLLKRRFN